MSTQKLNLTHGQYNNLGKKNHIRNLKSRNLKSSNKIDLTTINKNCISLSSKLMEIINRVNSPNHFIKQARKKTHDYEQTTN